MSLFAPEAILKKPSTVEQIAKCYAGLARVTPSSCCPIENLGPPMPGLNAVRNDELPVTGGPHYLGISREGWDQHPANSRRRK